MPIGSINRTGKEKSSQKFTVDIGPGLGLMVLSVEKEKDRKECFYRLTGDALPDGTYSFNLKIPAGADKQFKFAIKNGKIDELLETSKKLGRLNNGILEIDAQSICKKHKAKKAALGIGVTAGVLLTTAAAIKLTPIIVDQMSMWLNQLSTWGITAIKPYVASVLWRPTLKTLDFVGAVGDLVGVAGTALTESQAVQVVTAGAAMAYTAPDIAASFGGQATAEIIYEEGAYTGFKFAKIDYDECSNNLFQPYQSDQRLNIMQE